MFYLHFNDEFFYQLKIDFFFSTEVNVHKKPHKKIKAAN